jgi:small subunit ribosomal protein S10
MKQKVYIRFQTFNKKSFQTFIKNLEKFALNKKFNFSFISLPIQKKKYTVLKSPHVNKKAKDQFELKLYNGLIVLKSCILSDSIVRDIKKFFHFDSIIKISLVN